jgi:hypothetical protein
MYHVSGQPLGFQAFEQPSGTTRIGLEILGVYH